MPFPLLPIIVIGLGVGAFRQAGKRAKTEGVLTPQRQQVFEQAMQGKRDPAELRDLARAFRAQGLPGPAELLEKRAKLRELSPELTLQRRAAFKKAMTSQDPAAVNHMADLFEREGALGAAAKLRQYAAGLPKPSDHVTHVSPPQVAGEEDDIGAVTRMKRVKTQPKTPLKPSVSAMHRVQPTSPQDTPQDAPQDAPQDTSQSAPQAASQAAPQDAPQDAPSDDAESSDSDSQE